MVINHLLNGMILQVYPLQETMATLTDIIHGIGMFT